MNEVEHIYNQIFEHYPREKITDLFIDQNNIFINFQGKTIKIDVKYNFEALVNEIVSQYKKDIGDNVDIDKLNYITMRKVLENYKKSLDFSYQITYRDKIIRNRIHTFLSKGEVIIIMRLLSDTIFDMEYLGFTKLIIKKIIEKQTGLILISGPVGSGKTSTAVSLLDYYNTNFALHIITVEDPIEYIFTNKKSLIHQKEVNVDVSSFERSTVEVLREKSNILFLGEIVDYHSANLVLQASAIGQLVISTIHAGSSVETLERFTSFFNRNELDLVKKTLALFLNCIINQRLVYKDNKIKLLYEVLLSTQEVKGALFANNPFSTLTDALVRQRQVPIERQLEQINSF